MTAAPFPPRRVIYPAISIHLGHTHTHHVHSTLAALLAAARQSLHFLLFHPTSVHSTLTAQSAGSTFLPDNLCTSAIPCTCWDLSLCTEHTAKQPNKQTTKTHSRTNAVLPVPRSCSPGSSSYYGRRSPNAHQTPSEYAPVTPHAHDRMTANRA